jgi:pseudaminic acid cytidylyltransferase
MDHVETLSCLAVIPARLKSKRIHKKNIQLLNGKPLIAYTIAAALDSGIFGKVIVSTDSEEIANHAVKYGAEIPFIRNASLADDITPTSLVTLDALEKVDPDGHQYDFVAQLMATCPLRNAEDVRNSYFQFEETDAESQISVARFHWQNPWWAMQRGEEYRLIPLFDEQLKMRSQDLPILYCPTGAIWWAKTSILRRERTYHTLNRTGWEIPWYRAIDIDTEEDLLLVKSLMSNNHPATEGAQD